MKELLIKIRSLWEGKGEIDAATKSVSDLGTKTQNTSSITAGMAGKIGGWVAGLATFTVGFRALTSAVSAAGQAFAATIREGIEYNAQLQTQATKFETLLGSASKARRRIDELAKFAASTPFQLEDIAKASATLETLTGGALSTGKGLRVVGDAAAVANVPMAEMATTIGRAFSALQANRPAGEAIMRLQELGLVSGDTRNQIEALSEAGEGGRAWDVLSDSIGRFDGQMQKQSETLTGMISTFNDLKASLSALVAEGVFEELTESLESLNAALSSEDAQISATALGTAISDLIAKTKGGLGAVSNLATEFDKLNTSMGGMLDDTVLAALPGPFSEMAKWTQQAVRYGEKLHDQAAEKLATEREAAELAEETQDTIESIAPSIEDAGAAQKDFNAALEEAARLTASQIASLEKQKRATEEIARAQRDLAIARVENSGATEEEKAERIAEINRAFRAAEVAAEVAHQKEINTIRREGVKAAQEEAEAAKNSGADAETIKALQERAAELQRIADEAEQNAAAELATLEEKKTLEQQIADVKQEGEAARRRESEAAKQATLAAQAERAAREGSAKAAADTRSELQKMFDAQRAFDQLSNSEKRQVQKDMQREHGLAPRNEDGSSFTAAQHYAGETPFDITKAQRMPGTPPAPLQMPGNGLADPLQAGSTQPGQPSAGLESSATEAAQAVQQLKQEVVQGFSAISQALKGSQDELREASSAATQAANSARNASSTLKDSLKNLEARIASLEQLPG